MPSPPATEILVRGKDLNNQMVGSTSAWVAEMPQYARRIETRTVLAVTTIYKAWAPLGSAEDAEVWMVQQIVLDEASGLDLTDGIAGGDAGQFAFTWDDRASHSYS